MASDQNDGFRVGVRVRITDGTFAGMVGRLMGPEVVTAHGLFNPPPSHERQLYWVMVPIFGREAPAQLEAFQLKRQ